MCREGLLSTKIPNSNKNKPVSKTHNAHIRKSKHIKLGLIICSLVWAREGKTLARIKISGKVQVVTCDLLVLETTAMLCKAFRGQHCH